MNLIILTVGKESAAELANLQTEYERRLSPHVNITWQHIAPSRADTPDAVRNQDSQRIMQTIKPSDTVIVLDERGVQQTNEQFAQTFERLSGTQGRLVIIIGGAFGITDEVRNRAQFVWSFSKLVFPHQLMRVMLLEQLYRSIMVQRNHPYHHT